jgi:DNA-binding NarL/FixJ family response regulator
MSTIRILLADDHALVRAGIRSLLTSIAGFQVVAEAGDGYEALRLIGEHAPQIALFDIGMPGLNGLETAARVTKEFPAVRVVMLSMHKSEEYVLQALRAGAAGYLLKDANTTELELAIHAVARGETYLSPGVSRHVIADYLRRTGGDSAADATLLPTQPLTPRQREILQLIAEGHTTQAIAQKLSISVKTVETHRSQLMERLDIHDIAGLVRYAIRIGIVSGQG